MPLLLRSSMEKRDMKKYAMVLMYLANAAMLAGVPAATLFYGTGAVALAQMAVAQSRRCAKLFTQRARCMHCRSRDACASRVRSRSRSWQTGINRVAVWSFDNMYSEEECWTQMRFAKEDVKMLSRELAMDAGLGYIRTGRRGRQNVFQPIEVVVTLLTRMAYPNRWEDKLRFLGGRTRSAYVEAFYFALDFIYANFAHCITDINRWAGNMQEWADAIHNAGAHLLCCGSWLCFFNQGPCVFTTQVPLHHVASGSSMGPFVHARAMAYSIYYSRHNTRVKVFTNRK